MEKSVKIPLILLYSSCNRHYNSLVCLEYLAKGMAMFEVTAQSTGLQCNLKEV